MTQTTNDTQLTWGSAKGEAAKNGLPFMKFQKDNQFRIISNPVARYVYWVNNAEGKPRTFECLAFNRTTERFDNSQPDPIRDLGLKQKGEGKDAGKMVPLKCKRAYVCLAINRATGKVEAIDLKKSIFDGVMDTAAQLGKSPMDFDVFVQKTGSTWTDTKYTVQQLKCGNHKLTAEQLAEDKVLIDACDDINELFPRFSYQEIRAAAEAWLSGAPEQTEDDAEADGYNASAEAINELED